MPLAPGIFPEDFKLGLVTPIFKSGKKKDMNKYRPVAVLLVCSTILEKFHLPLKLMERYMTPTCDLYPHNASECWATAVDNFAKITSTLQQIDLVWTCSLKSRQHHTCR